MRKNILFTIIFTALVCLIISCKQKKQEEKTTPVQQTLSTTDSEIDRLTKEIRINPANAEAYYQRSKLYIGKRKMKLASADISRAIALDSTKSDYFMIMGEILFTTLQIPQATEAFKKSIALDPKNSEACLKLAEINLYIKNYKQSIQYANEALKIDKHKAKAYFIKGFVFKETGDTVKAISSFQTCVEQEPENYDAFMQLGILFSRKQDKLAVQYYNNALRLNPKSIEALYGRGLFYQDNKELNRAMEDYTAILQIDPSYKDAHYNMGFIHLVYLKVYDQAIRHFTDAIRSDPYYVQAYYNRGLCFERLGDIAAAEKDYRSALGIFPSYQLAKDGLKRIRS